MKALGVDVVISAPQKGWSASPCAGLVMMSARAEARLAETTSDSFSIDLAKWRAIMKTYEDGGHAYHATMPTDGFDRIKEAQWRLGDGVRQMLAAKGVVSVAADGFGAPGVVVGYTSDPDVQNGKAFAAKGMQIAAGVPLQVGEPEGFSTFRLGLFGLDKLYDVDATLARLGAVVEEVL
jgi:aspartate aminotransferase-like enzyme